ncbi:hypothetical protein GRQ63_28335 [Streptomyces sp. YIM 132580]|nr:hypothetical protein [Streptomyces sp. YIM 132580]
MLVVAASYRRRAVEHPELFQLLYGAPPRHYAVPAEGPTTQTVRRIGALFQEALLHGYTAEHFAAADLPEPSDGFSEFGRGWAPQGQTGPPASATALFMGAWGRLHGLVALEVFGHTSFIGVHPGGGLPGGDGLSPPGSLAGDSCASARQRAATLSAAPAPGDVSSSVCTGAVFFGPRTATWTSRRPITAAPIHMACCQPSTKDCCAAWMRSWA